MNLMNNFFEFNCVNFFLPNKIILEKNSIKSLLDEWKNADKTEF